MSPQAIEETAKKHPAPFTESIIDALADLIPQAVPEGYVIHDPFGGEGLRLGALCDRLGYTFTGTDLEPWRGGDPRVLLGDSTKRATYPSTSHAVVTSPCLAHGQRVLRDDLRWVPVEEIRVGDRLVAFDEHSQGLTARGYATRRKWQMAKVLHSAPQPAECMRVILDNGESVVCTPNHPWLADRYQSGGNAQNPRAQWVEARDLAGRWVYRQLDTWEDRRSYEIGWLAGIIDGEGTLASGARTSLKLSIAQSEGLVLDLIVERLKQAGYDASLYWMNGATRSDRPHAHVFLNGGMAEVMRLLGEVRPARLLQKWASFDLWGRKAIQAPKVRVDGVEPAGVQTIQALTTSTATYIGEGYLHHNTYNNGCNDHFEPKDDSRRLTYRVAAGRPLHENNTGRYSGRGSKSGEASYWRLTRDVVACWPDIALVNVKDSTRAGEVYPLVQMWDDLLREHGYDIERVEVACPGWRFGTNHAARSDTEAILVAKRGGG